MNRQQKEQVVGCLKDKFAISGASVIVQYKGLTVKEMRDLRKQLREQGGALQVAKARLMKRAVADVEITQDLTPFLKNQIGMVFSKKSENAQAVLKVLSDFSKNNGALSIVAGCVQDRVFDSASLVRIASLPPKEVLLAQAIGTIQAPVKGFVCSLNQLTLRMLWALKQIQEKNNV